MNPDYVLTPSATAAAQARGLVNGQWFKPQIEREQLKALMKRDNAQGARDTVLWFGLIFLAAALMVYGWMQDSAWTWFWFFIYSALYGGSSDSRWHEYGHGTPFKAAWVSPIFYQIAAFMVMRRATRWRWSHARHHSDTLIRGRDPEIAVPTPPNLGLMLINLLALQSGWQEIKMVCANAFGRISAEEQSFIPAMEQRKVIFEARVWLAIWLAVLLAAWWWQSGLPLLLIGGPSFAGAWLYTFFGLTQHAGLPEDVLDHRANCRTVYMNPLFRFLYWNMNYHLEHHLFPMVPYHALPRLHQALSAVTPPPYPSTWAAYREILPALWRQRREPRYAVARPIPTPHS